MVDVFEVLVEVFVVMVGDQQQVVFGVEYVEGFVSLGMQCWIGIQVLYGLLQGIDDGVVGDQDLFVQMFMGQVGV